MRFALTVSAVCVLGLAGTLGESVERSGDAELLGQSDRGAGAAAAVFGDVPGVQRLRVDASDLLLSRGFAFERRADVVPGMPRTRGGLTDRRSLAHYGTPGTWFSRHAADADKARILRSRVKHAADVERFFANHARLARTHSGRAALWQHGRMGRWARRALRIVRRHMWHTLPAPADWVMAVRVAQRPFPGSQAWLLSCSSAESSHGAWVTYGSHRYRAGVERTGIVGGWLQYRWETFKAHYRRALADLRRRGFRVPPRLRDAQNVAAWRSPLAQALAGGWGILHGQRSHWYASYGRGC